MRAIIEDMLRQEKEFQDLPHKALAKKVSEYVKDPRKIKDPELREQLYLSMEADLHVSPYYDHIRNFIGKEYEIILLEKLRNLDIPHMTEDDLKFKGYDKTPDVRLLVPIGVDHRVVMWIDSKASFGSVEGYEKSAAQFQQYVDRYGPGMVIYWFGFTEGLKAPDDVYICSDIPNAITFPSGRRTFGARNVIGGLFHKVTSPFLVPDVSDTRESGTISGINMRGGAEECTASGAEFRPREEDRQEDEATFTSLKLDQSCRTSGLRKEDEIGNVQRVEIKTIPMKLVESS
eukprot:CAMPEP_0184484786 /NCGR_PEP_ID=MMETSP0113_2-20130426/6464_1 /TAXON_ID=91329 /ORGANISM="Norrisiella sphaerica, Strain BC52" /LENGTH=288 /DNA_ID=CAMNT_0026865929 /DNA_START=158 /DNA_END=1024 /DNA_ORIENTATION=-